MTPENVGNPPAALPPPLMLHQMATAHYLSRALYLAAKWKIADLLKDGPKSSDEIASAIGTHAHSLKRLMLLLVSAEVFTEPEDGRFALAPLGELLRTGVAGSMRSSVMLFAGISIQDAWKELEYCVQPGNPAFRRSGETDPFAAMSRDPEAMKTFNEAMATFAPMTSAAVAAAYDFSAFRKVVDVGGGNGTLLIGILKANLNLHGVVFDLPRTAESARDQIAAAGLDSRCEIAGGDFFESVPEGADAYMLKHVIHDWNDSDAARILKNCHRAMPAGGTLLIVEGVYPARIDQSYPSRAAAANDLNMLVSTGGRQRSEAEFRSLYKEAGFRLTRIVPTPARVCVIEGARA